MGLHRIALQHLDVAGQPKLTGRRGIQIWSPIARGPGSDDTRDWTRQLSRAVEAAVPELVSWEWNVRDRGGKARLDYTQNVIKKTLVAPYSPRASAGTARDRCRQQPGARIDHNSPTRFHRLDGCVNKQLKSPHGCRASRHGIPGGLPARPHGPPGTRARSVSAEGGHR